MSDESLSKKTKVFISHSSKDAEYVEAFVELLEILGLRNNDIICSSVPSYGIPLDNKVYDWLVNEFQNSKLHVIYALSKNYYASAASLNEMGAAWALKHKWTGILLPGLDFSELDGCIDKTQISIKLDDTDTRTLKFRLGELKDAITREFDLVPLSEAVWERHRDKFLEKIHTIAFLEQIGEKTINNRRNEEKYAENDLSESTRFDKFVSQRQEVDLIQDYQDYYEIKPIVSYRDPGVLKLLNKQTSFMMNIDISDIKKKNTQDFVMALFEYVPSEDWSAFYDAGYYLEFDAMALGGIHSFQLEIKDEAHNKIVDKQIYVDSSVTNIRIWLPKMTRERDIWKHVAQMCFTVFFNEAYLKGKTGTLWIEDLKMSAE